MIMLSWLKLLRLTQKWKQVVKFKADFGSKRKKNVYWAQMNNTMFISMKFTVVGRFVLLGHIFVAVLIFTEFTKEHTVDIGGNVI